MTGICLYYVEDNEADRRLLALALDNQGVSVKLQVADDGERAYELLEDAAEGKRCRPDLVVLDLNIPKRSGLEVLAHIRGHSKFSNVPVVVLTSSDSKLDSSQAHALGVVAYLRKPMELREFMDLGRRIVELTRGVS